MKPRCAVSRWGCNGTRKSTGFTLIELIMSLTIIGIMAILTAPLLAVSVDAVNLKMSQSDINELTQLSLAKMTRDIRRLRDIQSIQTATATDLIFLDKSNNTIRYFFNGTNLLYDLNSAGSQTLANNLQSGGSAFTYYDQSGAVIGTPTVGLLIDSNIRRVQIKLVFLINGQAYPVQTQVRLRNVPAGAA